MRFGADGCAFIFSIFLVALLLSVASLRVEPKVLLLPLWPIFPLYFLEFRFCMLYWRRERYFSFNQALQPCYWLAFCLARF